MVNVIKIAALAGAVAIIAGCAPRAQPVTAPPPPAIQPEPGFTKF
jgi:hypothetical protein